jgi:hypothetical protein
MAKSATERTPLREKDRAGGLGVIKETQFLESGNVHFELLGFNF